MTKTEYRAYIASAEWQERRKEFLESYTSCNRCSMPRWLASIAYDQDLHVHHRHYATVGCEQEEDLEPLCRRCHDLETFGRSDFRKLPTAECGMCHVEHFDPYATFCQKCNTLIDHDATNPDGLLLLADPTYNNRPIWQHLVWRISYELRENGLNDGEIVKFLAKMQAARESLIKCPA